MQKIKFGCLNIIRAHSVHHLQQTVPFSMLNLHIDFSLVRKTHHHNQSRTSTVHCPSLPMVFGLPDRIGSETMMRSEWKDDPWIFGEVDASKVLSFLPPNVGPRLYKSLVVQNVFRFWQVRDGGLKLNTSNTCELNHPHEILGYL